MNTYNDDDFNIGGGYDKEVFYKFKCSECGKDQLVAEIIDYTEKKELFEWGCGGIDYDNKCRCGFEYSIERKIIQVKKEQK